MNPQKTVPWMTLLKAAVLAGCAVYLLTFLGIGISQIRYPYEIEWMEGGMVDQVRQVVDGQSMYRSPDISFVAYTYTPLFFHLSAWLSRFTGLSFVPLRLIAFLSTLGCILLIFLFVRRETKSAFYGFLSGGLFAAMYDIGGSWYTVARSDMLLFFLMLAGIYLLRSQKVPLFTTIAAAVCFFLAFMTKQTALFVAVPLSLYTLIFFKGIRRWIFPVFIALFVVGTTHWFNKQTDGWYSFYIFELPGNHRIVPFRIFSFWVKDILSPFFIACCFMVYYACRLIREKRWNDFFFAFFVLGALVGVSFLVRIRTGSFVNTVLPAYVGMALYFAPAAASFIEAGKEKTTAWMMPVGLLACLAQLMLLFYDPTAKIPTGDDRVAGDHLISVMKSVPGPVYIPGHGYYAALAGKEPHAQRVASLDIERSRNPDIVAPFTNHLAQVLGSGYYAAVILDDTAWYEGCLTNYTPRGAIFPNGEVFQPVTGRRIRPEQLYIRNDLIQNERKNGL